jgi:hypothetical protein
MELEPWKVHNLKMMQWIVVRLGLNYSFLYLNSVIKLEIEVM